MTPWLCRFSVLLFVWVLSACSESGSSVETAFQSDSALKAQVQNLMDEKCAACHDSSPGGQVYNDLTLNGDFEDLTVDVTSFEGVSMLRIKPNEPEQSYLFRKIEGTHQEVEGGSGSRMPLEGGPLTGSEIDLVRQYINSFAERPVED